MFKSWRNMKLWKRVFIGLAIGVILGLFMFYTGIGKTYGIRGAGGTFISLLDIAKFFGDMFVRLIKMLVVPLIATTLISGVVAMGDPKKLRSLGARTLGLYMLTTFFAVSLGLIVGSIFQPGSGFDTSLLGDGGTAIDTVTNKLETAAAAEQDLFSYLLSIIPTNPVAAFAQGDVIGIIVFSVIFGIGIIALGEKAKPVAVFFDAAAEVMMKVTMMIMNLAPYGVLALIAWVLGTKGLGILSNMGKLAAALYLACILQIIFIYGGIIIKTILKLPLKRFFFGIADALGVAYSTASSNATLPVSISCAEHNLGVEKSVAGSVLPLGATINMDGTAIYLGIVAMFAAQMLGIELSLAEYGLIALTATMTSIGAAGIPSAGLLLAAGVLQVIGVTDAQATLIIAFIFPFDRLLDMMRTATNVTGDIAVACTVAKWEGQLDAELFKAPPQR